MCLQLGYCETPPPTLGLRKMAANIPTPRHPEPAHQEQRKKCWDCEERRPREGEGSEEVHGNPGDPGQGEQGVEAGEVESQAWATGAKVPRGRSPRTCSAPRQVRKVERARAWGSRPGDWDGGEGGGGGEQAREGSKKREQARGGKGKERGRGRQDRGGKKGGRKQAEGGKTGGGG